MDLILSLLSIILFVVAIIKFATRKKKDIPIKVPIILLVVAIALFIVSTEMSHRKVLQAELDQIEQNIENSKDIKNEENIEDNNTEKTDKAIDKEELESIISKNIGEDEKILEIVVGGKDIFIEVDLGEEGILPMEDLAYTRYSSITDALLEQDYWNDITVEFKDVGKITMNTKNAKANEYGKYFDTLDIMDNFTKKE